MNTKENDIKSKSATGPGTGQRYQEFLAGRRDYEISELDNGNKQTTDKLTSKTNFKQM